MSLESVKSAISKRFAKVRTGLTVGFDDKDVAYALHDLRGGLWMDLEKKDVFPFEDSQFDIVVLNSSAVSPLIVRESHRVLRPEGFLVFSVKEKTDEQGQGYTQREIYKIVRGGFDIVDLVRVHPWAFWVRNRSMTVCARKKTWRERKGLLRKGSSVIIQFGNAK